MKEPQRIKLDPETPSNKDVNKIPMPKLYPDPIQDDLYSESDKLEKINKLLDDAHNEDTENSN